jgi:alanine racemase
VKNWVEISEERLTANYRVLTEAAGEDTAVLAVVKANAYGHGVRVCAPMLARAGCGWLGVTDSAEGAVVLGALGPAKDGVRVMVMSGLLAADAEEIVRLELVPVVWTRDQMEWLVAAAERLGVARVPVHIEIDTGMARQGVTEGPELMELVKWVQRQPRIRVDGVLTHFASSEVAGSAQTMLQRERFERALETFTGSDIWPEWVHAGNSSTVDNDGVENMAWLRRVAANAMNARPMVRTGIALYGYCLPIEEIEGAVAEPQVRPDVRPVMTWKTRVIGLRDVHPRDTVGYNAIFSAQRPMRLALLPVGYADGLRRELSGSDLREGGWVMVKGLRAAIVGRVSMNLTIVDVTEIAGVAVGDEVVVLGDGITADDHARLAKTIAYEIVCSVKACVLPEGPAARGEVTS